uniref:Integrase catalytic domain-containing protein n=1 Tax=Panagrolaimus sp. JU765 TaxID=591449 RepID=A0AC34R9C8_9BILA
MTEKETQALSFVVKKLHRYIYGRHFTLRTDHQALLSILGPKKNLSGYAAGRLERIAMMLGKYDFTLEWVPATKMEHADCLSRLLEERQMLEKEEVVIAQVCTEVEEVDGISMILDDELDAGMSETVKNLDLTTETVRNETESDPILATICYWLKNGWPTKIGMDFESFARCKSKLSMDQGIILYEDRVVVPESLRKKVLMELHQGHPGSCRMKMKARMNVYWPNMDKEITRFVENCCDCQVNQKMPIKRNLEPWPIAKNPMDRIHIDFAGPFYGKMFLLVIDACSKFPFIQIMKETTAGETIKALEAVFKEHGYPKLLVSDNGPQFKSEKFEGYCKNHGIKCLNSAPYHPQSNGQAERFVDTMKRTLKKMENEDGSIQEKLDIFLYENRSTPNAQLPENKTPAEVFLGRKLRTKLADLKPVGKLEKPKNKMEYYFNRHHGTKSKEFEEDEKVWVFQPMKEPK